jgi:NNP family nitrate/nitrite transporter-like MFS transporter
MQFLPSTTKPGSFSGFFSMFLVLFIASGIANGSTFRMVPVMFKTLRARALGKENHSQIQLESNRESAAVLGFISAFAAYGGFFIPKAYGTSFQLTGGVNAAFTGFLVFYITCIIMTWWFFSRKNAPLPC